MLMLPRARRGAVPKSQDIPTTSSTGEVPDSGGWTHLARHHKDSKVSILGIPKSGGGEPSHPADGPESHKSAGSSLALRQLWVKLAAGRWNSLAAVPTAGVSSLSFATSLVEAAGLCGARVAAIDAHQCDLRGAARVIQDLATARSDGARVVAAVDSVLLSLAAMQVALAADAVLLLVPYQDADLDSVRSAIDTVGRDRLLGCVAFRSK